MGVVSWVRMADTGGRAGNSGMWAYLSESYEQRGRGMNFF
jgi:hypothetical protein